MLKTLGQPHGNTIVIYLILSLVTIESILWTILNERSEIQNILKMGMNAQFYEKII